MRSWGQLAFPTLETGHTPILRALGRQTILMPAPRWNLCPFPTTDSAKQSPLQTPPNILAETSCFWETCFSISCPSHSGMSRLDSPVYLIFSYRHPTALTVLPNGLSPLAVPESYPTPLSLPDRTCHALHVYLRDVLHPLGAGAGSSSTSDTPHRPAGVSQA